MFLFQFQVIVNAKKEKSQKVALIINTSQKSLERSQDFGAPVTVRGRCGGWAEAAVATPLRISD